MELSSTFIKTSIKVYKPWRASLELNQLATVLVLFFTEGVFFVLRQWVWLSHCISLQINEKVLDTIFLLFLEFKFIWYLGLNLSPTKDLTCLGSDSRTHPYTQKQTMSKASSRVQPRVRKVQLQEAHYKLLNSFCFETADLKGCASSFYSLQPDSISLVSAMEIVAVEREPILLQRCLLSTTTPKI